MAASKFERLIAKLKRITVDAGATEAEAMAAAAKAKALADEHGLDLAAAGEIDEGALDTGRKTLRPIDRLYISCGAYAGCFCFTITHPDAMVMRFVGPPHRVQLALWMSETMRRHIDRGLDRYKAEPSYRRRTPARRRKAAAVFVEHAALELSRRIRAAAAAEDLAAARGETPMLAEYMARRHPDLKKRELPTVAGDRRLDDARRAGARAAADVVIARPVEAGAGPTPMIGRGT